MDDATVAVLPVAAPPSGPLSHFMFPSESESEVGTVDDTADGDAKDELDEEEDEDEDDDGEELDKSTRAAYVGRGNVQAVRAARKAAGLNDCFPRSDPLLTEFAAFLEVAGQSKKDIANKVTISIYFIIIRSHSIKVLN